MVNDLTHKLGMVKLGDQVHVKNCVCLRMGTDNYLFNFHLMHTHTHTEFRLHNRRADVNSL